MRIAALVFVVTMALGMAACGDDPCAELEDLCDSCSDATLQTSCRTAYETTQLPLVGTGDDGCQDILDSGAYDECN